MKTVSKDGFTWFEKGNNGKTSVGFTKALIAELEECWHILPAASNRVSIKEGQPLCSVETNDGLFCVASPMAGVITFFDGRATNFPDKIVEETIIAEISEAAPKEEQTALERALDDLARLEAQREPAARLRPQVARDIDWNIEPMPLGGIAPAPQRFFADEEQQ